MEEKVASESGWQREEDKWDEDDFVI